MKTYTPSKSYALYDGEIVIDFYERYGRYQHVYIRRDNGEWLKSVTGATGILDKPALIPWACGCMHDKIEEALNRGQLITPEFLAEAKNAWREKRDSSADYGTITHLTIHEFIKYKLGIEKKAPVVPKIREVENAFLAFRDWVEDQQVEFIATEQLVYSKKYNFVGTLDSTAKIHKGKERFALIDFKSSNGIYGDMIYQTTGYNVAYEEENRIKLDSTIIARFGKQNAEFEMLEYKVTPQLVKGFLSCLYLKMQEKDLQSLLPKK